jgi:eukaryotic-like serine/threonine-protein kinase
LTPEQLRQIEDHCHSALEREPGERASFLAQLEEGVRTEVESLLAQRGGNTLPALEAAETLSAPPGTPSDPEWVHRAVSGSMIAHYQLAEKIGGGGNGTVWKAYDTLLTRPVALKFLLDSRVPDPLSRESLIREARAASALNHPNIITIYEINFDRGQPFIAMELVGGQDLSEVLRRQKRIAPSVVVEYAIQLCHGLGAAHHVGIVHRDIKPSNVMVNQDGIIKILDFGLAKAGAREAEAAAHPGWLANPQSHPGRVIGTVPYMSPEQASGDAVGPFSDVFSVGIVLYELLSGRRPFQGSSNKEIIQALLSADPPPLSSVAADVPETLARIVHKCLQRNPAERYRDAGEIASQVRALDRSSLPGPKSDVTTVTINAKAWALNHVRRRPRRFIAAGLMALALAAPAGYKWWPSSKDGNHSGTAAAALAQTEAVQRALAYLQRYDRKGNIDSAVALLEAASRRSGASASVYATLAEAYVWKYNESSDKQWLTKATESGRKAVRTTDALAAGHVGLGLALSASGKKAEAIAEFERAIDLNPRSGPAYIGLARLRSGKDAEQLYQRAVDLSPGQWIPLNELGVFYYRERLYDESVAVWRRALRFTEDNVRVMANLAAGLHKNGAYAEAADTFQVALGLDESNPRTWVNLGTSRYFQGRYLDAALATEKAVKAAPKRYLYWGNLGDNYRWAEGKRPLASAAYGKAIELLREEVKASPNDIALRSYLAWYLAKSGDISGALAELSRLGVLAESDALFRATIVYELASDRVKALDALGRAVRAGYSMHEATHEPELATLRSDPRYAGIAGLAATRKKE